MITLEKEKRINKTLELNTLYLKNNRPQNIY